MDFNTLKAIHLIFIVTWFAGLFYIVRLFIYHTEAKKNTKDYNILSAQFKLMQKRLWYGITYPSLFLTLILGSSLLSKNMDYYLNQPWIYLKLIFVLGLVSYHLYCGQIFKQLQNDVFKHSTTFLRIWNEVATVFLVCIIFIAIFKNTLDWLWALLGLLVFSGILMLGIYVYKKIRN
jgi:putative membrane protein